MSKTYLEAARPLPVEAECDILVVGGGAAGHSAAIAAARAGAKNIILLERYGYMGGDVTGGYVIMVPNLSWYEKSFVRGLQEEWFTRLASVPGAVRAPSLERIGSTDPALLHPWMAIHDCVSRGGYGGAKPNCLVRSVYFEPNQLKIEMDKMLLEHRDAITVMCHSWVSGPIVENGVVRGVVYESKEGRKAIFAKQVIDATGDGDLYTRAGAPYASMSDGVTRANTTALVWRIGGVDGDAYYEWKQAHPAEMNALRAGLQKTAGFRCVPMPSNQNDIFWMNNWHMNRDCAKVSDQTETEMNTRATMRETLDYLREAVPVAFRHAYLYDIAPQLGTRISHRLNGEYVMSTADFAYALHHEDVIAWHSTICQVNDCGPVEIPYRAILPQGVENLLCPGRHLSADGVAIDWLDLIPQCVGTGQAAGVAAAVAVSNGSTAHGVDIRKVQDILVDQDVPLPRNAKFLARDSSYQECVETHRYGLYTDKARLAAEQREKGLPLNLDFQEDINKPNVERKLH